MCSIACKKNCSFLKGGSIRKVFLRFILDEMTAKKLFCQTKEKQNADEENRCDSEHSIYSFKSNNVRVGKGYSGCGDFWQARPSHSVIEPSVSWKPRTRELWERRKSVYCAPVRSENARLASAIRTIRDLANTEGYDGTHFVPLPSIVKKVQQLIGFFEHRPALFKM